MRKRDILEVQDLPFSPVYPKVHVLVLSYNGKHLLDDCLSSYLENDYPNFEVVVIDNGSDDGTLGYVRENYPHVRIRRTEKNLGYSGGFNLGLSYAFEENDADYVLITNNDVKADRRVITELVRVAEMAPEIGFVTGKVYYHGKPDVLQTVGKSEDPIRWNGEHIGRGERDRGQYDEIRELSFGDDIFTLVRGEMYRRIGGYNPVFFLQAEEYDWQARAKKAGYRIFYTPHAKIWHKESMTIGKFSPLKAYYDARNPMLVILLHQPPEFFRRYFWVHFCVDILRGSLGSIRRRELMVAFKKWQGFLSGLVWGVKNRKYTWRHFIPCGA